MIRFRRSPPSDAPLRASRGLLLAAGQGIGEGSMAPREKTKAQRQNGERVEKGLAQAAYRLGSTAVSRSAPDPTDPTTQKGPIRPL